MHKLKNQNFAELQIFKIQEVSSEKPAFSLISAPSPDNTNQIEQQPKLSTQLYRSIDQEAGPINALPAEKTAKKEERRCNIEISVDVNKITEKTLEFRKEQCNEQIAEKSSKSLATSTAAPSLDCDRLSIPIIHLSSMPKSGRNLNNPEELCSSNKASAKVNTTNIEQQICEETTKKLQNADNLYSPSNDSMKKIQRDYDQVICFQARSKNKEGKPSCEPKFSKTNADQIIVNKTNPGAFKEKKSAELQIDSVKENTSLKEELFNKALSQLAETKSIDVVPRKISSIRVVLLQKTRSNECFIDANIVAKHLNKFKKAKYITKQENETMVLDDPQYAALSATVSLGQINVIPSVCEKHKKMNNGALEGSNEFSILSPNKQTEVLLTNQQSNGFSIPLLFNRMKPEADFQSLTMPKMTPNFSANRQISTSPVQLYNRRSESPLKNVTSRTSRFDNAGESFTNRLSKGLVDFTQGSSYRLQKWKNKLQNGRKQKDSSEPPPVFRRMPLIHEPNEDLTNAKIVVDLLPSKMSKMNAANHRNPISFASSAFPQAINRPRILYPTRSENDALGNSVHLFKENGVLSITDMEHRTLRQTDENNPKSVKSLTMHFQNLKDLNASHHLTSPPMENDDKSHGNLPPPARITPYSGIKPQDSAIIHPIAFRPFISNKNDSRQSLTSIISHNTKSNSDSSIKRYSSHDGYSRSVLNNDNKSYLGSIRPKGVYQPSTSCGIFPMQSLEKKTRRSENEESDYDIVPEYLEQESLDIETCAAAHRQNIFQCNSSLSCQGSTVFGTHSSVAQQNSSKKSPSSQQICGSNGSNGSHQSSGIHVTPSPSDSGIVDYETIIRDKENELTNVRTTMEHNEEIVIRVYQEKERLWREKMTELKHKLKASQQGENALRQQIQRCNEQRDQFQTTIQNLMSDKQGLQRKCLQIERELFQLREKFDEILRNREIDCEQCRKGSLDGRFKPPIPAPRMIKDSSADRELRVEVEQLKGEIFTLKESLNEQLNLFANERKYWAEERAKILSSARISMVNPNGQVENRFPIEANQCVVSNDRLI